MIEQATRLGIGLAIVSKESLEGIIAKATKENGISEKEAKQAVKDLVAESKRREEQLKAKVKEAIKKAKKVMKEAGKNSPIVSRAEALKMKAEIAALKQKLKNKKK